MAELSTVSYRVLSYLAGRHGATAVGTREISAAFEGSVDEVGKSLEPCWDDSDLRFSL